MKRKNLILSAHAHLNIRPMINLPNFLKNHPNLVALNNSEIINNSQILIKDNHLTFKKGNEFFVVLDNYDKHKVLNFNLRTDQKARINLLIYNSKTISQTINIYLKNDADVEIYTNFISRRKTKLIIDRNCYLEENSHLKILNALTYNGDLSLNDNFFLTGLNAKVDVEQLNVGGKTSKYTINQAVYHNEKSTISRINNSLITTDLAKMNYTVVGSIQKGKEFSKCSQKNKGIMLSNESEISVVPTLYIDEYNVEASHGAAIGQIDELQLYYLLSRGLSETEARSLIISGYTNPFISLVENSHLQKQLTQRISQLL